jgi:hypothetical protein
LEFDFVQRVIREVKERALKASLGDSLHDEDLAVLRGFAIDNFGFDALEAFFDPRGGLAPLEIEGNLHLGGIGCPGETPQNPSQNQRSKKSHERPISKFVAPPSTAASRCMDRPGR